MANGREITYDDIGILEESSKALLGYFVHRWFHEYLVAVNDGIRQLYAAGLITSLVAPTDAGRRSLFDAFDPTADKLRDLVGTYLYLYLCHKSANYRLMHRFDGKQVLFLRGYDVEGAVSTGGTAMGSYSIATAQFGATLRHLLERDVALFKVASSLDVYWETLDAQPYFDGDYDGLRHLAAQRPASLYLNADGWREGVAHLVDRMDHYVVYVSSLTESVRWEIDQLDTEARRDRVTVIFDEQAIAAREGPGVLPEAVATRTGAHVVWSKPGAPPSGTASDLRSHLSARFLVTTKEAFEADIDRHRQRIAGSASTLGPGERETRVDFRFHPAVGAERLTELHDVAHDLEARVAAAIRSGVDCLPLFLAQVQLRIYMTLLLGQHDETGRALAAYAGIMRAALDHEKARAAPTGAGGDGNGDLVDALQLRHDMGRHMGITLLACGKSHEFDSIFAEATAAFNAIFDATTAAVAPCVARVRG